MKLHFSIIGNGVDWCKASLMEINDLDNCDIYNTKTIPFDNKLLDLLCAFHYSERGNKYFELPLKSIWYKSLCKKIITNGSENIIIIYDHNRLGNDESFLKYIKKKYKNVYMVYVFTNVVRISGAINNNFVEKLKEYYDEVYAFDPTDSPKYGFNYHPLLYSRNDIKGVMVQKKVFYVGRAKDRYSILIDVYAKLKRLGIDSLYYIFGVKEEEQKYQNEINYNKMIPYSQCLRYIQESFCLIDIIQGESEGYTIKVCEAVFYNKLLITTNSKIKEAPFYNPNWILVIKSAEDINLDFFSNYDSVSYDQNARNYFSAKKFIDNITMQISSLEET